jgi:hypothetical protein
LEDPDALLERNPTTGEIDDSRCFLKELLLAVALDFALYCLVSLL